MPRRLPRTTAAIAAVALITAVLVPTGAASAHTVAQTPTTGGSNSGDPYYPTLGDSGYDATDYALAIRYAPSTRALSGTATIRLTPTETLSSLYFDLRGLTVHSVRVNGHTARFTQPSEKLRVQPSHALRRGSHVTVVVRYSGTTGQPIDNTDSLFGWVSTPQGALVASEAYGAPTWYPVNDSPADKARYSFTVTVPAGKKVVANGLPTAAPVTRAGWTTFRWAESSPMSSYLASIDINDYRVTATRVRSLTYIDAIDPAVTGENRTTSLAAIAKQPAIIAYFQKTFGPYPFTSAGSILDANQLGYALETQSRPLYTGGTDETTVAHETAHQWFGDSVTPRYWKDIWLNEGFATYAEWLWDQHAGITTFAKEVARIRAIPATDDLWSRKTADPGPADIYDDVVYDRGGLTLVLLQKKIGTSAFDRLLKTWASEHRYGNATTAQFIALAEKISHQNLGAFFHTWLYTTGKPTGW